MKHLIFVLALAVSSYCYMSFDEFIAKFKKNYTADSEEYEQKRKIYEANIIELQQKNCSACGVTKFFDVAHENFTKSTLASMQMFLTFSNRSRKFHLKCHSR